VASLTCNAPRSSTVVMKVIMAAPQCRCTQPRAPSPASSPRKIKPTYRAGVDGRMACHPSCSASGAPLGASPGIGVESVSIASALARYSWDIAIRRVETSSEEEARDRRRQTSACRRKYSALGTGSPLSHARNSQDYCTVPDKRRTFQTLSPPTGAGFVGRW
jgi:hypothetical protein